MKCRTLVIISFMLASCLSLFATDDPLWQKAYGFFHKSEKMYPSEIISTVKTMDKNKEVDDEILTEMQGFIKDGEYCKKIVRVIENGKDVTEKEIKEEQVGKKKKSVEYGTSKDDSIFNPLNEPYVTICKIVGQKDKIGTHQCVAYKFTLKKKSKEGKKINDSGFVWLDEETGAPIQLQQEMHGMPIMAKDFKMTVNYDTKTGNWLMQNVKVEGRVSLLIKTKLVSVFIEMKKFISKD